MQTCRCPQCGTDAPWPGNPSRPFCSERCRLIDLGAWVNEEYRVPGENKSATDPEQSGDEDDTP